MKKTFKILIPIVIIISAILLIIPFFMFDNWDSISKFASYISIIASISTFFTCIFALITLIYYSKQITIQNNHLIKTGDKVNTLEKHIESITYNIKLFSSTIAKYSNIQYLNHQIELKQTLLEKYSSEGYSTTRITNIENEIQNLNSILEKSLNEITTK